MLSKYWKLEGKKVVECKDVLEWGKFFENENRFINSTEILEGAIRVSTVFLGIDHSFSPLPHAPLIFETMVFGGSMDQKMDRYSTYKKAEAGHQKMVDAVHENLNKWDEPIKKQE